MYCYDPAASFWNTAATLLPCFSISWFGPDVLRLMRKLTVACWISLVLLLHHCLKALTLRNENVVGAKSAVSLTLALRGVHPQSPWRNSPHSHSFSFPPRLFLLPLPSLPFPPLIFLSSVVPSPSSGGSGGCPRKSLTFFISTLL